MTASVADVRTVVVAILDRRDRCLARGRVKECSSTQKEVMGTSGLGHMYQEPVCVTILQKLYHSSSALKATKECSGLEELYLMYERSNKNHM